MKIGLRFRLCMLFGQIFSRKLRLVLTILGVFFPLFLILCSFFILDSFYYSSFDKIGWMKQYGVIDLKLKDLDEKSESFIEISECFSDEYLGFKLRTRTTLEYPISIDGRETYINLSIYSANSNFDGSLVLNDSGISPSKLVDGRVTTKEDMINKSNVVIIGNTLARLMFGEEYLGEKLVLPYTSFQKITENNIKKLISYISFEIIGTFDDSSVLTEEVYGERTYLTEQIYIPWNITLTEDKQASFSGECVFAGIDGLSLEQTQCLQSSDLIYSYNCFENKRQEIIAQNKELKSIAGVSSVVLSLLSLLMIGQTMLFSVKERLPEFGIKRAIGASAEDIAADLIAEALLYAFMAFFTAFVASTLMSLIFLNVATSMGKISEIHFVLKGRSLLVAALIALFTSLSAVCFPMCYINNKNIEDTIRFE